MRKKGMESDGADGHRIQSPGRIRIRNNLLGQIDMGEVRRLASESGIRFILFPGGIQRFIQVQVDIDINLCGRNNILLQFVNINRLL